jgi:hypothetical protein
LLSAFLSSLTEVTCIIRHHEMIADGRPSLVELPSEMRGKRTQVHLSHAAWNLNKLTVSLWL